MHFAVDFCRLLQTIYLIKGFFAALGTLDGFLTIKLFKLCDNLFLMFDLGLLVKVGLHHICPYLKTLLCVVAVISVIYMGLAIVQFHNLSHYLVKEITVMGHDYNASLISCQKSFKPGD